jgi:hypothetical protein
MNNRDTAIRLPDMFSEDEHNTLCCARQGLLRLHPVGQLLTDRESANSWRSRIIANTDSAVRQVAASNQPWLERQRQRLLDTKDFSTPASALAEIRAFGALREAHFSVRSIQEGDLKTTDFAVSIGDAQVAVEVVAKQIDPKMGKTLEEILARQQEELQRRASAADMRAHSKRNVLVSTGSYEPFGGVDRSKPGDSLTANAISRIRRIEDDKEEQLPQDEPTVLWVDFQDDAWALVVGVEQAFPVTAWRGGVTSGSLWYAHYGWKGAPIMEHQGSAYDRRTVLMGHEGKFREKTKLAAVVISCPATTILFENPSANIPLPDSFRRQCLWLPSFSSQASIANWTPALAQRIVNLQVEQICHSAEALIAIGAFTRQVDPQLDPILKTINSQLQPPPKFPKT